MTLDAISPDAAAAPAASRPLRIAQVAPAWLPVPPPGYGGIERMVGVLTDQLVARGHEVTLFAVAGSRTAGRLAPTLAEPPHIDDADAVFDDMSHSLYPYLRTGEFDVIHDHSRLGLAYGAVLHAADPAAPAVIHTLHGPWTPRTRRLYGLLHDRIGLVAISAAQAADNPDVNYAGIVHNGLAIADYPYREDKEDFLVFVGRVHPDKGPADAVRIARRAGLPLKMVLKRNERQEQAYWDDKVAPLLRDVDEVVEQPPEEVKLDLLSRARATLFPIDWPEPFGLVMVESMACGTPVIAQPLGAVPEVVEHGVTGLCCDTIEEMAQAVADVAALSPADCRDRARREFSSEVMAAGYERVYRQALVTLDRRPAARP